MLRIARRVERIERHLQLLAEHEGVSLEVLTARDDVDRLGEFVTDWRTLELAGIDPTTGEAIA